MVDVGAVDLLTNLEEVREVLDHPPLALFVDIDGTLARIVTDPKAATIPPAVRQVLGALSRRHTVVVVSGRSVADARRIIGLDSLVYACNHGLEWWYQGSATVHAGVRPYRRQLRNLVKILRGHLRSIAGANLEDKGATISVHYRQARLPVVARTAILNFLGQEPEAKGLVVREGKMVVEVRPPVEANKGTALKWVVENHGIHSGIVIGDDQTDLDAFHMMEELTAAEDVDFRGVKLGVVGANASAELLRGADYHLQNPESVELFLQWLVEARPSARVTFGEGEG
jgi:trehalose-phosphatase